MVVIPSSKRSSNDSESPLALSSTSKKLCLDQLSVVKIKQEKLTKAEMIAEAAKRKSKPSVLDKTVDAIDVD